MVEARGEHQDGSLARAFERLRTGGIRFEDISRTLSGSWVSPVLTAHPTEVQRKSTLDAERAVADLLAERRHLSSAGERARNTLFCAPDCAALANPDSSVFQTERLGGDRECPDLLPYDLPARVSASVRRVWRTLGSGVAPFFRMGNWIGGDRDGNPNVNADTLAMALRKQSETALRHYLAQLHELGAELSISRMLVECSPRLQALADKSDDAGSHRKDEPTGAP